MHRNTYLLVTFLAIFAALVVGVNVGKRIGQQQTSSPQTSPTSAPNVTPTPALLSYVDSYCGISLLYPATLTKFESASGGAMLVDTSNAKESVTVACQEDIPRPALVPDRIETIAIGSISATLYHGTSAKDGTPRDTLIFMHPKNNMDVYIAGFGTTFDQILTSLTVLL